MREPPATNPPSAKSELVTDQEAVQTYQARIELLQATLNSLQREQANLHKLLEACNAGLKGIEQLVAAIPGLRIEHASIKKQLAELNTRFDAASEVLAEVLQSEDLPHEP
jgi:chromosome segregation ATPase